MCAVDAVAVTARGDCTGGSSSSSGIVVGVGGVVGIVGVTATCAAACAGSERRKEVLSG